MRRSPLLLFLAVVLLAACGSVGTGAADQAGGAAPLGAPDRAAPVTLQDLLSAGDQAAAEWQDRAVPVEITVELIAGRWTAAQVTYLAPESDRFLRYATGSGGGEQSRPTLATLSLQPVTASGLEHVPPPPDGLLDPDALLSAAGDALAACGVRGSDVRVSYATGAPFAWDGSRWTQPPAWSATISDGARFGVVDPVTGESGGGCGAVD